MSYLSGRLQRVKVAGCFSQWTDVNCGVPQGSVLGPLLFNVFINDLFYMELSGCIANYADDNNLYNSNESLSSLQSELSKDVDNVISWYTQNNLDANPDKFQ